MLFRPSVNKKQIYKTFGDEVGFTIKMSGTITVALLIIYAIFALILNQIGSLNYLDFFSYLLVILGICVTLGLLSPFIYSFFAINGGLHTKVRDRIKYTSFLKTYLIGTHYPFSGQLKISMTLIKAILLNIGLGILVNLIVYFVSFIGGTQLNTLVNEILTAFNSISDPDLFLEELNSILIANEAFINELTLLTSFFPLVFSVYYFLHTIARNTFRYYVASTFANKMPKQFGDYLFNLPLKIYRKDYNLNYYSVNWPLTLIYFVVFTLSYFLLGYFGPAQMSISILELTSIVIPLIVLLPFLPVLFNFHEELWKVYNPYFTEVFLDQAKRELDQLKNDATAMARLGAENLQRAEKNFDFVKNTVIKNLTENYGYEESDFEGLDAEEIYKNIGENESYAPYRKKMERLKKEQGENKDVIEGEVKENKENAPLNKEEQAKEENSNTKEDNENKSS